MLTAMFRRWEERAAAVTEDGKRRVPMDWGLGYLGLDHAASDPAAEAAAWADRASADGAGLYGLPEEADGRRWPFRFDGQTLTFPTPSPSGHAENDTAVAEVHDAGPGAPAVVVLPQWNGTVAGYRPLGRYLRGLGLTTVLGVLPYHGPRRPAACLSAEYLVSANIGRTLHAFRQAVLETRLITRWLSARGAPSVGLIGNSSGSLVAFLAGAYEPLVTASCLNLVTGDFARAVWEGISTRSARAAMDGRLTLPELQRLWRPLAPLHHVASPSASPW
jgi:hypothetical protein